MIRQSQQQSKTSQLPCSPTGRDYKAHLLAMTTLSNLKEYTWRKNPSNLLLFELWSTLSIKSACAQVGNTVRIGIPLTMATAGSAPIASLCASADIRLSTMTNVDKIKINGVRYEVGVMMLLLMLVKYWSREQRAEGVLGDDWIEMKFRWCSLLG